MRAFNIITSRENPLIKLVAALQVSSEKRKRNGLFVLEGLRICKDACDNGIKFDKLIVSDAAAEKYAADTEKFSLISDECYFFVFFIQFVVSLYLVYRFLKK